MVAGSACEGSPGFTPGDPGNADVGPERTRELELGFDMSALNGRIGIEATHYNARTTNALVNKDLPSSLGFLPEPHGEHRRRWRTADTSSS